MKFSFRLPVVALLAALPLLSGCGSKPTGDLSGTVKYKGKPVVTGTVTVYDSNKAAYQGGIQQGQYTVKNVPEGPVEIIIVSDNPNPAGTAAPPAEGKGGRVKKDGDAEQPATPVVGWFAIPKKYEKAATSNVKTTVKAGPNPFDIELVD